MGVVAWQGQMSVLAPRSSLLYSLVTGEEVVEGPLDPSAYAQAEGPGIGGSRLAAVQANDSAIDPIGQDSIEAQVIPETLNGNAVVAPLSPLAAEPATDQQSTSLAKKSRIYTIADGDTLSTIAAQFDVSVNTVLWANGLTDRNTLKPGNHLVIPPTTGVLHAVRSGDTLLAIAQKYDVKSADILDYNNLQANGTLRIGQQIMVPDGALPEQRSPQIVSRNTRIADIEADGSEPTPAPQPKSSGTFFQMPVVGYISQRFGHGHTGIDIARTDRGTIPNVFAAGDGKVEYAGWLGGYGNLIVINHGNGWLTYYGHLSKFYVHQGGKINQGDAIGKEGETGHASGYHVHLETRHNGQPVDPCASLSAC